ncbi:PLP-dependent aminotransferase family protein [Neobacillus niacini]|uniref:aminotransferase-like domain-containing protein n=1 Tax=Neobacillus niacini TaxID=86668 RepID=UPI0021CB1A75|nr:PLP-dependent aminotransferase family protein [Neobacillus niacini]MCM3768625.1 PLP-dependent aminotransferase family protein [Neobacillus niacini]
MPVNSFENYPMSWKPDKKQLVSPLYKSIASLLEYDILNGFLAPNTKLPPQRELADYLDINLSTVTRAFKICEVKGLIYAVTGRGTFVTPNVKNAIFMADSDENKDYIEMGIIKPLDHTNSYVAQAIKSIAAKDYLESLLDYRHPLGMPYHRMAAKKWMQRFNMDVPIENIAITSGGQNSFSLILMALFHPGDKIAVDLYTYPNFVDLAKIMNIQLIPIEGDEQGMSPDRLDAVCRNTPLQGIYLNPSCNNPTAVTMTMNRRKEIAEVINKHELILIEDDVYSFLGPDGYYPISHYVPERFVYILSVAKSLSSGVRVAFIAYAERFMEKITYGIFNLNVKTSALNAEIITELIHTGAAEQIIKKKREISEERNRVYQKYFQLHHPSENPISFFRWLPLNKAWQLNQFEQIALTRGIHVFHSHRFLVKKDEAPQFVRISLTSPNDIEELEEGLCRLKNFLLDTEEALQ